MRREIEGKMAENSPRLAVRAVLIHEGRLLLVNAYPDGKSDLMCAPGGGVERGSALPDNLIREVFEETGLKIAVGVPCLVNEFHDPQGDFHQVDIYFRCTVTGSADVDPAWQDAERIVTDRRWVTPDEMRGLRVKPDSLAQVAFGNDPISYDPLEPIVR
ncbi:MULTISPECIES: NUDIX domain-containing protein [Sulfitobacter]|uniref:NUDIX domain-containing protein n=1 Tax=Sulfitobacter TaxID=60136 RepID=UPI000E85CED6|nr:MULTISPECIES: NUDIX hydrolase [Sulfitobacter]HAR82593.1 NUDIX hydrolase [Sulfitobacter pontiacus]HBR39733.1 NUDIX hydrolase [Sulfitobacter pontiacus]|tara:strand:- start:1901 stop:2377 length:477 start_codon:yes stop_codon:yes gene_type:complete